MPDSRDLSDALRTARSLLDLGHSMDIVLSTGLIPPELQDLVRLRIEAESNVILTPARVVVADQGRLDWLASLDRSEWYYWPSLRQFLLHKGWSRATIRSIDDSSDRVLRQLYPPATEAFDVRGLVLGFVQSGKTANFTALTAKAADAGYRLVIVLSGVDNGLRKQTNIRLKKELVGYTDGRRGTVPLPPLGRQWHEFTAAEIDGDFRPGYANHAALQGSQPVLLVVKKNGDVLRRLLAWLEEAPKEVRRTLPLLVVDDEADQASVDTRGTYQTEDEPLPDDYEPPAVINGLIRQLLGKFERRAYVAYTATPFANILIPHDTVDPKAGNDLYPKDFIVDLPKPDGYFGTEEIFGWNDRDTGEHVGGLSVTRSVRDFDVAQVQEGHFPEALRTAINDFVIAGACRAQRGDGDSPATMLVHTSALTADQARIRAHITEYVAEIRDEWRYQRDLGVRSRFEKRWSDDFLPTTAAWYPDRVIRFEDMEAHIGPFLEKLQVREVNSAAGEVLDYEHEPSLKAIAIGGNRLSRGLTLEGLLVSFFVRRAATYDTLMQMGRWFGFRSGYEDLTRIWMTDELAGWFADLAFVEHRLREDIGVYESLGLTPYEVGLRILQHPTLQVTSPLKRRFTATQTIAQSYSLSLEQTFKFPFNHPKHLANQESRNLETVKALAQRLSECHRERIDSEQGPIWTRCLAEEVLDFLRAFQIDSSSRSISLPLIIAYIERLSLTGELTSWSVAVRGRKSTDKVLGVVDWGLPMGTVNQISRSRIAQTESLGVITSPGDELVGLDADLQASAAAASASRGGQSRPPSINNAARAVRPPEQGLLLLYPISRHSGHGFEGRGDGRQPLFSDPCGPYACDLVGLALSFPRSNQPVRLEAYLQGTVEWRPIE